MEIYNKIKSGFVWDWRLHDLYLLSFMQLVETYSNHV